MDICSVAVPLIVLLEAGKHLVLLKFRVLGRLYSVVPEALSVGDAMAELGSSRRLSCLELCILSTLNRPPLCLPPTLVPLYSYTIRPPNNLHPSSGAMMVKIDNIQSRPNNASPISVKVVDLSLAELVIDPVLLRLLSISPDTPDMPDDLTSGFMR